MSSRPTDLDLLDLLEGGIDPSQAEALRRALDADPARARLFRGLERQRMALRSMETPATPRDFVAALGDELAPSAPTIRLRRATGIDLGMHLRRAAPLGLAAALGAALTGGIWFIAEQRGMRPADDARLADESSAVGGGAGNREGWGLDNTLADGSRRGSSATDGAQDGAMSATGTNQSAGGSAAGGASPAASLDGLPPVLADLAIVLEVADEAAAIDELRSAVLKIAPRRMTLTRNLDRDRMLDDQQLTANAGTTARGSEGPPGASNAAPGPAPLAGDPEWTPEPSVQFALVDDGYALTLTIPAESLPALLAQLRDMLEMSGMSDMPGGAQPLDRHGISSVRLEPRLAGDLEPKPEHETSGATSARSIDPSAFDRWSNWRRAVESTKGRGALAVPVRIVRAR